MWLWLLLYVYKRCHVAEFDQFYVHGQSGV